jgi:hypothetical protein
VARDLRDILDGAAGTPPDLPDIEVIRRRARPALIRRRAAAGLAVVGLTLAAAAVTAELGDASPDRGTTVVHTGPSPAPRELRAGQLEPGTYVGRVGHYGLRLTLPTDDWTLQADHDTWLALTYRQYVVHLQVWGSVVPDDSADGRATEATPPDIAGWLASNDRITATASRPGQVGGMPATEVVIRVARPLDRPPAECTTSRCVVLARIAGVDELVHVESGERARVLVVGDPGAQVVVTYRAPEDEFAVLDEAARGLLSGLQLTPSS